MMTMKIYTQYRSVHEYGMECVSTKISFARHSIGEMHEWSTEQWNENRYRQYLVQTRHKCVPYEVEYVYYHMPHRKLVKIDRKVIVAHNIGNNGTEHMRINY